MDTKKMKNNFHKDSFEVIKFLSNFKKITYVSTLLVVNNHLFSHQSNGYADWDQHFYDNGIYKDSLLLKLGLELTKLCRGDLSTVVWDDVIKTTQVNPIDLERRKHDIYHGVSFIYSHTDNSSVAINVCTSKNTTKKEFEDLIFPMRLPLLNYFNGNVH